MESFHHHPAPTSLHLIGFTRAALLEQERKFKRAKCGAFSSENKEFDSQEIPRLVIALGTTRLGVVGEITHGEENNREGAL